MSEAGKTSQLTSTHDRSMEQRDTQSGRLNDYAEVDVVELDCMDVVAVATREPHFLDYDAMPPPELEENYARTMKFHAHHGEQIKMEKKYERDGEVSDYELAASGYTKKEFTQDDNTLFFASIAGTAKVKNAKAKHFLDENPIPPDYMLAQELREHRSLDRNFERQSEQQKHKQTQLAVQSKSSLSAERTSSSLYGSGKYAGNEVAAKLFPFSQLPRGAAWTKRFDEHYCNMPILPTAGSSCVDVTLGSKVECVYSLLSMLGSKDPLEIAKKFFELSENTETCATLRRSGCIPLLVQMLHSAENDESVRKYAGMALQNVVHRHPDEKAGRREAKVMRLLDQIMDYCNFLKSLLQSGGEAIADDSDRHPLAAISSLMKVSFDEEHRHAMCELGALHAIPNLVHLDHAVHGPKPEDQCCNSLRRYALMALTNLTFGDENNKALLCSQKLFMEALIAQLDAAPDDLLQVTASVLRNLSWRADSNMKAVLNEIGTVTALARAAMSNKNENTLKAILSALWNLSAHCSTNKAEFCAVEGALAFLVNMLTYEGPSKTLKIIENAGGILRNVSSHIAVCESYRQILREHNCLSILLQQLKSESLTVVSNSCGTLWNLSARCPEDQKFLWDNGAIPMLRSLIHSKHAMISEGSSSALKNLLNFRPAVQNQNRMDPIARSLGLKKLPTLNARKQKALQQELGESVHAETSDNLDDEEVPVTSKQNVDDTHNKTLPVNATLDLASQLDELSINPNGPQKTCTAPSNSSNQTRISRSATLAKSESRDSIFSSKSDSEYENIRRSQSASDANRSTGHSARIAYELENDVGIIEEQPIDYSVKYNEDSTLAKELDNTNTHQNENGAEANTSYPTYQETDLDQLTDFSLRYGENQIESDGDNLPVAAERQQQQSNACKPKEVKSVEERSEILLILEDSVKCYQTEDTPYIISNAASVTDLRQGGKTEVTSAVDTKPSCDEGIHKRPQKLMQYGSYTPEKPINYCEEGTPGYFSRYDSLSSLDEAAPEGSGRLKLCEAATGKSELPFTSKAAEKHNNEEVEVKTIPDVGEATTSNINSALETPLMFSRRSSMDSLVNEDVGPCDDKSSVVSDFSRLASGVISPSEIPDSPTQSMPESPRRSSVSANVNQSVIIQYRNSVRSNATDAKRTLHSVFEDDVSKFNVENTPAQFSCATSLSNLSIVDDEQSMPMSDGQKLPNRDDVMTSQRAVHQNTISEGEEDDANINNNDDLLLASCINMGMNRASENASKSTKNKTSTDAQVLGDEPKHYCTEDTPALLSKVGSNTNLSLISSMDCSRNETKDEVAYEMRNTNSHNLSDEVSSNASDCGAVGLAGADLLQQCILDGMKKPTPQLPKTFTRDDPIAMMRRGGTMLPPYLPVSDEMSKYLVEDSPCNFSVVSGLSNLTVGSSLVGPAVQLQENAIATKSVSAAPVNSKEDARREQQFPDDSLSSLSIDSEDDTNLLSQAIAAGCNRPKSNLGFNTASTVDKSRILISASQPIPILTASSTSSLTTTTTTARHYRKQQHVLNNLHRAAVGNNESYSSVDSSDSNDNQSKSLFEFSILTGMYKTGDEVRSSSKHSRSRCGNEAASSHSNPNLKQFDSLPMPLAAQRNTNRHGQRHHHQKQQQQHRERELKDEKLLLECIKTGISKKVNSGEEPSMATGTAHAMNHEHLRFGGQQQNDVSKNVQATSAAALAQCHRMAPIISTSANDTAAAPDVEMNTRANCHNNSNSSNNVIMPLVDGIINAAENQISTVTATKLTNYNESHRNPETNTNTKMKASIIGSNVSTEHIFYNANVADDGGDTDADDDLDSKSNQSFMLDTPNTFNVSQTVSAPVIADKHRDPDLMLKSVERLTMEFVTSAEQLRTQVGGSVQAAAPLVVNKRMCALLAEDTGTITNSSSSSTWNEHSCPNDVSFPSVSVSAPMLTSLNTNEDVEHGEELDPATEADVSKLQDYVAQPPAHASTAPLTQPNSIETETDTLVNEQIPLDMLQNFELTPKPNAIHFELGGEVQSAAAALAGTNNQQFFFNGTSASIMSNSTIIAYEARALSDNLRQLNDDNAELTFSLNSLDLDNIRPPSGMESLNMSGCYNEQPSSMQHSSMARAGFPAKSPKFLRKTLPMGLLAKRALGQLAGSAESVNSSCNLLDNIKPPSLMDELLDSMASVASIQSEIADGENHSMATTISLSNYETAAGGQTFDDNTVTLQSCCGSMLHDDVEDEDDDATFNDFSSAGSTPKQTSPGGSSGGRRTLTPKQKRLMAKDRYRTYTICSPLTPSERGQDDLLGLDDTLQVEIIKHSRESSPTDKRRRQSSTESAEYTFAANIIDGKQSNMLEKIVTNDAEDVDTQQNSETESCHAQEREECSIKSANRHDNEDDDAQATHEVPKVKPDNPKLGLNKHKEETAKCVRGRKKPAYISPYSYQQRSSSKSLLRTTNKTAAEKPNRKTAVGNEDAATATADAIIRPLERQGTFVKDEPTNTTVHVPVVVATTATTLSPNHRASKLPTKRTLPIATATTQKRTTYNSSHFAVNGSSSGNNNGMRKTTTATHSAVRKIQTKTVMSTNAPQRSNTNIRLPNGRVSTSNRAAAQAKAVSRTTPPSRSNSNLNNGSNDALISQAQSRIANIWKRVGDAKAKQLIKPTAAAPTLAASAGKFKAQKSNDTIESSKALNSRVGAAHHKPALIRSSTFESTPKRKTQQMSGKVVNARK